MTLKRYIIGFALSIVLTLLAFGATTLDTTVAMILLVLLAVVQLVVQLVYFLHIGEEKKPYFNALTLSFALFIVAVLVGGSLWIMNHLDREHATHDTTDVY